MTQNRLAEFRKACPGGRIETTIINCKNGELIVKAEVYVDREDTKPVATGHGYAKDAEAETCEMKAVEKALVFAGYQSRGSEPAKAEKTVTEKPNQGQDDPGEVEVNWRDFQGKIKNLPAKRILWLAASYTGKDSEAKKAAKAYLDQHPELLASVSGKPA